jgi:cytochrome c553
LPKANSTSRFYLAVGCFACHGRSGQGGAMNGPAPILAKTAMPFDGFKGQLREPISDMPAYSEVVMSDKQIADIYAFLQTLVRTASDQGHGDLQGLMRRCRNSIRMRHFPTDNFRNNSGGQRSLQRVATGSEALRPQLRQIRPCGP